jgi:hypothetical protein
MSVPAGFFTNGAKNSFISDAHGNSLVSKQRSLFEDMLSEASGRNKDSIYRGVNMAGATSAGIYGQSGNVYLDCLVDPSRGPCRLPDEFDKPTAVHQEVIYFTVNSGAAGGATDRSSVVILNPFIGDGGVFTYRNATVTVLTGDGAGSYVSALYQDPDRVALSAICNNIRPVSASLYLTYIGDTFSDGGQIAGAEIPGNGIVAATYLSPSGQDLRLVQNIAIQPMAYSGPLNKGIYAYWTPEDVNDSFFQTISSAAAYSFPILMADFKSTQPSATVLRGVAVVNYEYTTPSRLVTSLPSPISPDMIISAKQILQSQPRVVANDDHGTWWSKVLDGARDLFSTIGTGFYNLFHPAVNLVSQAANDPGIVSAADKYATYRGIMAAVS